MFEYKKQSLEYSSLQKNPAEEFKNAVWVVMTTPWTNPTQEQITEELEPAP